MPAAGEAIVTVVTDWIRCATDTTDEARVCEAYRIGQFPASEAIAVVISAFAIAVLGTWVVFTVAAITVAFVCLYFQEGFLYEPVGDVFEVRSSLKQPPGLNYHGR